MYTAAEINHTTIIHSVRATQEQMELKAAATD